MCLQEFDVRRHARSEGRRYCDPVVLTYQAERMPEQIRLKVNATRIKLGIFTTVSFTTTTRIPRFVVFSFILGIMLSKPHWDYEF